MGTWIVGGILVVIIALVIRVMIRDKKNGKACGCGTDCKGCSGSCHH